MMITRIFFTYIEVAPENGANELLVDLLV
jgi:hypothetical protein